MNLNLEEKNYKNDTINTLDGKFNVNEGITPINPLSSGKENKINTNSKVKDLNNDENIQYNNIVTTNQIIESLTQYSTQRNSKIQDGSTGDYFYHYIDQVSNVDSISDKGTHSSFNNLLATDNAFDNITETESKSNENSIDMTGGYVYCTTCDITVSTGTISLWI